MDDEWKIQNGWMENLNGWKEEWIIKVVLIDIFRRGRLNLDVPYVQELVPHFI